MAENALVVSVREGTGKGVARKLRAVGRIPGVCYGAGEGSVPISLDPRELKRLLVQSETGMNTLIDLKIEGGGELDGRLVLVKELQRHPVDGSYVHADLFAVDMEHTIEVSVPIHVSGHSEGVKMGGILDQSLRELDLECMPRAIPGEIAVDVSALNLGETLHVRDLELPEGVTLRSDPDLAVVGVVAPAAEEEPEAAEGEVAEAVAEGEAPAEGEGEKPAAEGEAKEGDE